MFHPTLNYLPCADNGPGHRMAYWQWGDAGAAHTVLCVHGLTRQGRDFDVLAQALLTRAAIQGQPLQVICPDVVGRGQSDWLVDPQRYQLPFYSADLLALLAWLQPQTLDWVGTSMGGLIAMGVCPFAHTVGVQVRRLVLNDVGPTIEWEALERIGTYLGRGAQFATLQQAADALWVGSSSFGPHSPAQWLELSRHMVRPLPAGQAGLTLHYDPAIALPFRAVTQALAVQAEALTWQLYDSITADTLLVRGAESDLLSPHTARQMTQRGPMARLVEFAGVGHAPTLIADDQVEAVASFLGFA